MAEQDLWFIEYRSVAFASLRFTKGGEATARPHDGAGSPIDLLIELITSGKPTLRFFGVQLIASLDLPSTVDADKIARSRLGKTPLDAGMPICVLAVGVRDLDAVWRWVVEPSVQEGAAILRQRDAGEWEPFDEGAAARLIAQVRGWYDVRAGKPPAKPRGRRASAGS